MFNQMIIAESKKREEAALFYFRRSWRKRGGCGNMQLGLEIHVLLSNICAFIIN
jgi:hypothetical protein